MKNTTPKIAITQDTLKVAPQEPKIQKTHTTTKQQKKSKPDDIGYTYCYVLTTKSQKDEIQLTKHSKKLEGIIKSFFLDRLIAVSFTDDSYTLQLKDEFSIGEKRKLGRNISQNSDLHKFAKRILYNGESKDISGQLFRLKKVAS